MAPAAGEDLWVFGYGSLMWNPGFEATERVLALLKGYHRSFCVFSHRYRGTPVRPGLVLGLDHGGSCRGLLLRVPAPQVDPVLAYLWDREMPNNVYRVRRLPVRRLDGGCPAVVRACCFLADRNHGHYCGDLEGAERVRLIREGVGIKGANADYLSATVQHLRDLGIVDTALETLHDAVIGGPGREG